MGADLFQGLTSPSLKEITRCLTDHFSKAGIETASLDARLLIQHVLSLSHAQFISAPQRYLSDDELKALAVLSLRRLEREPVSRIFGEAEFWSLPFTLSPDTLDPRPDTETLVELALDVIEKKPLFDGRILDLGTGSGCILLALLSELPLANGCGVDISGGALETARRNAKRLGLAKRSDFICSDWFSAVSGHYNLILSNPPYIPGEVIESLSPEVAQYDPRRALDGGASGLEPYHILFEGAPRVLKDDGWLIVEFGEGQLEDIFKLLDASPLGGLIDRRVIKADLAGIDRVLAVHRRSSL